MKYFFNVSQKFVKGLLCVQLLILSSVLLASSEAELITTIILIDRQAELVDVSLDGEVMKRHVSVPDYFTSGRSHQSSLKNSLKMLKDYGSNDRHMLPKSSSLCSQTLQSYLLTELSKQSICSVQSKITNERLTQTDNAIDRKRIPGMQQNVRNGQPHLEKNEVIEKANEQISFAETFFPVVDRLYPLDRQHILVQDRFHRGVFKDT